MGYSFSLNIYLYMCMRRINILIKFLQSIRRTITYTTLTTEDHFLDEIIIKDL